MNEQVTYSRAASCYLPVLGVLVGWRYKTDRFIARHALAGTLLWIYTALSYFVGTIGVALSMLGIAAVAVGFHAAARGQEVNIPGIRAVVDIFLPKK